MLEVVQTFRLSRMLFGGNSIVVLRMLGGFATSRDILATYTHILSFNLLGSLPVLTRRGATTGQSVLRHVALISNSFTSRVTSLGKQLTKEEKAKSITISFTRKSLLSLCIHALLGQGAVVEPLERTFFSAMVSTLSVPSSNGLEVGLRPSEAGTDGFHV